MAFDRVGFGGDMAARKDIHMDGQRVGKHELVWHGHA